MTVYDYHHHYHYHQDNIKYSDQKSIEKTGYIFQGAT